MGKQDIDKLMETAMNSIKNMIDVNTIVGDPVETVDGSVIMPISKVSFGFAAGGSDNEDKKEKPAFAGGSGAGIRLIPVAFLVVQSDQIRLLPVTENAVIERLVNIAPEIIKEIKSIIQSQSES